MQERKQGDNAVPDLELGLVVVTKEQAENPRAGVDG